MPRFFIHMRHDTFTAEDDVGLDLPGLEEANAAAVVSARETVAENVKSNSAHALVEVVIADDSGAELAIISAKEILPELLR